jgi:hypothetical protein
MPDLAALKACSTSPGPCGTPMCTSQ